MRPLEAFADHRPSKHGYADLADVLVPDWALLDRHYWRRDFQQHYGNEMGDRMVDAYAGLAGALFGQHPQTRAAQIPSSGFGSPEPSRETHMAAVTLQPCAAAHRACILSGRRDIECLKALHRCNQGVTTIFGPGIVGAPRP
jgi:hypothetical protein